jgi:hypothetical protein
MDTNTITWNAVEWKRDYRDLEGARVELLMDQRVGRFVKGKYTIVGVIPAGTRGVASRRDNAGFRGLEWTFTTPAGAYVTGVPGCFLLILP